MEIKTEPGGKTVEIWLTQAESQDTAIQSQLKPLYQKCKAQGYTVVVFCSGSEDLVDTTSTLLCSNRNRMAQAENSLA